MLFVAIQKMENPQGMGLPSALIGDILSRKVAKTAHFKGYKIDSLRALRLGEKSSLPTPNRPSPSIGILPS